jgi:predicted transcriptional regulator
VAFSLPDLRRRKQVAVRLDDQLRRDLNILMAQRQDANVSNILRWAVEQQAAPVRQEWNEAARRRAEKVKADG